VRRTLLRTALAPDRQAPARARAILGRFDEELPASGLRVVRLLVSELVANSVRHGMTSTADEICLEAVLDEQTLRIAVTDRGSDTDPEAISGRGLWLVAKLSDRWGIDNGSGSRVWFELDLGRVARPAAADSSSA
jgi:anti-sigma regulatory factor (Ser/Thr protein kinase)